MIFGYLIEFVERKTKRSSSFRVNLQEYQLDDLINIILDLNV